MARERTYACNLCELENMTEDQFCAHFYRDHSRNNRCLPCPICRKKKPVGTRTYGFSSHLHDNHGTSSRREKKITGKNHMFSVVICQRKSDGRFLLVEECCKTGWYLPAGRVDPGETFAEAAIRETVEEAGIIVKLEGIVRVELNAYFSHGENEGNWKERIIFYATPENEDDELKKVPDYESIRAMWISYEDMMKAVETKKMKLRAFEPAKYFKYVLDHPDKIYPMNLLKEKSHLN